MATGDSYLYDFRYLGLRYESDGRVTRVFTPDGEQICGAKRKGTLEPTPCKGKPEENGRCSLHAGRSLSGMASPAYVHGRYSKNLPQDVQERFLKALGDEDLLSVRDDIALVDAHIATKLDKIKHGESAELWRRVGEGWNEVLNAQASGDAALLGMAISSLDRLMRRGMNEQKTWDNIVELLGHRNKLVTSERNYLVEMGQMVPVEDVQLLIGVVQDIIATHVQDRKVLGSIQRDILRATATSGSSDVTEPARSLSSA